MSSIKLTGAAELGKALQDAATLNKVKQIVKLNTSELHKNMQRKAEAAFVKGYAIGATKRSITLAIDGDGLTGTVEPTTEYAPYLEYGTRFMEAEPFVKPAFNEQVKQFKSDLDKITR